MKNIQVAQATRNVGVCAFLAVPANLAIYSADVAFSNCATKTETDCLAAVLAGDKAAADNTGYSLDKVIEKEAVSEIAANLCARSMVKLDMLGNHTLSNSLNNTVSYYSKAADVMCSNRLMNVYTVMDDNLVLITADYLTAPQLVVFLAKINAFKAMKGSTVLVNTNNPVLTKAFDTAMRVTTADIGDLKSLVKEYKISQPAFYNGLMKACKLPAVTVSHTPVVFTITDATTESALAGVNGTLLNSKELPVSNVSGIMKYATVKAGPTTSTFEKEGYITKIMTMSIVRGKTNNFNVSLVAGIMTEAQENAIKDTIAQVIADKKAKAKARKAARIAALAKEVVVKV